MEVFPTNTAERVYSVVVLILALLVFTVFLSNFAAHVSCLWQSRSAHARQLWLLRKYLKQAQISAALEAKVSKYLEFHIEKNERTVNPDQLTLMAMLSKPLSNELQMEIMAKGFQKHPLFSGLHNGFKSCMAALADAFSVATLYTDDVVFKCGDTATGMVFISEGSGRYISELRDESMVEQLLEAGEYVAEAALWLDEWMHLGDCDAYEITDLLAVDAKTLQTCAKHPSTRTLLKHYAKGFVHFLNLESPDDLTDVTQNVTLSAMTFESIGSGDAKTVRHESGPKQIVANLFAFRRKSTSSLSSRGKDRRSSANSKASASSSVSTRGKAKPQLHHVAPMS